MSDQNQSGLRPLRVEEDSLVRTLLKQVQTRENLLQQLDSALVREMDDGGMGSLEFAGDESRSLGRCLVEAEYVDYDGVLVSIVLNADQNEQLYELDMWKVDFAPLLEYPATDHLIIKA